METITAMAFTVWWSGGFHSNKLMAPYNGYHLDIRSFLHVIAATTSFVVHVRFEFLKLVCMSIVMVLKVSVHVNQSHFTQTFQMRQIRIIINGNLENTCIYKLKACRCAL